MEFKYSDERFADIQMLRYRVEGFETLSLKQKLFVYYLSKAALAGRDILWDQNCRYNLAIRRMLEAAYLGKKNDKVKIKNECEWKAFETYVKRVWFANGIQTNTE